jgi:DNA modification methylase
MTLPKFKIVELSRADKSHRIRLSIQSLEPELGRRVLGLSSREIEDLLDRPSISQLKREARQNRLSVSSFVLQQLSKKFSKGTTSAKREGQLQLFKQVQSPAVMRVEGGSLSQVGSFRVNKNSPIHRWYPYVEGFSADRIVRLLSAFTNRTSATVYDPFGGSGTVQVLCSHLGIRSLYSELNPFMQFVAEVKVNSVRTLVGQTKAISKLKAYYDTVADLNFLSEFADEDTSWFHQIFSGRDYFVEKDLREICGLLRLAKRAFKGDEHIQNVTLLAVYCIAVDCSNMTRRADLRRRQPYEYKTRTVSVKNSYLKKLSEIVSDLTDLPETLEGTTRLGDSCLVHHESYDASIDLIVTSPPYLNGTNYFRNTKIELALANLITSETELESFTTAAVTAGINNVSMRNREPICFPAVERLAKALEKEAYDVRIAKMVRGYFSDMFLSAQVFFAYLKGGGTFVCDIGDSIFAGIHVPTHDLLVDVFERAGFEFKECNILRQRYSHNKQRLGQYELILEKSRG